MRLAQLYGQLSYTDVLRLREMDAGNPLVLDELDGTITTRTGHRLSARYAARLRTLGIDPKECRTVTRSTDDDE